MGEKNLEEKSELHIFDICGTLYKSNTTYDFLKFYLRKNNKFKYFYFLFLFSFPAKILWKFFYFFNKDSLVRNFFISFFRNESVKKIDEMAILFVEQFLSKRKIDEIHQFLENSLVKFHSEVWLVSASVYPVVKAIALKLDVKKFWATEIEVNDGVYTGKIANDLEGCKHIILERNNVYNYFIYSYTDSKRDAILVERSDLAFIVYKTKDISFWNAMIKNNNIKINFIKC